MKKILAAAMVTVALVGCTTTAKFTDGECTVEYKTRDSRTAQMIATMREDIAEACR